MSAFSECFLSFFFSPWDTFLSEENHKFSLLEFQFPKKDKMRRIFLRSINWHMHSWLSGLKLLNKLQKKKKKSCKSLMKKGPKATLRPAMSRLRFSITVYSLETFSNHKKERSWGIVPWGISYRPRPVLKECIFMYRLGHFINIIP